MPIQKGESRNQLEFYSLESIVAEDSEVRVIDLFLDLLDFDELGFENKGSSHEGRPAFAADVLLGIYIYGYLNPKHGLENFPSGDKLLQPRIAHFTNQEIDIAS